MKNVIRLTVHSVHPVFTSKGWNYLVIPGSLVECIYLRGKCEDISDDEIINTIYLS